VLNENAAKETIEAVNALREKPDLEAITAVSIELGYMSQLTSIERFNYSKLPEHGIYLGRPQKLSATPDLSGTVLPLCLIPNSALKSAPPFKSVKPKASASAGLLA
jgi:hypothetical protein